MISVEKTRSSAYKDTRRKTTLRALSRNEAIYFQIKLLVYLS
jgi:hypothetical protein